MSNPTESEAKLSKAQRAHAALLYARVNGAVWACPDCPAGVYVRMGGVTVHFEVDGSSLQQRGGEKCIPF